MPILHMETEQVRSTGRQLCNAGGELSECAHALARTWGALRVDWEGPGRHSFGASIENVIQRLRGLGDALETLGMRVQREADEWEQVDNGGAQSFSVATSRLTPIMIDDFSPWEFFGGQWGFWMGIDDLQELSRVGSISGTPLGAIIGAGLGFAADTDPDRWRALTSSVIAEGGVYALGLIPTGVGQAVLIASVVNDVIQGGGQMVVVGGRVMAPIIATSPEMAAALDTTMDRYAENLDRMDLDHLTHDLGRTAYDYVVGTYVETISDAWNDPSVANILRLGYLANPQFGLPLAFAGSDGAQQAVLGDFRAMGNDLLNVVTGLSEYQRMARGVSVAYGAAAVSGVANVLPVPESWQSTVDHVATRLIEQINSRQRVYDVFNIAPPREY